MTGDQDDIVARLNVVLPTRWFPDNSPILNGVLSGLAEAWSWLYSVLGYAIQQTRIATASDVWLDMIARDFFGSRIARGSGQRDNAFRRRILLELARERGTRAAVIAVLTDLTNRTPIVFEPARSSDTGGYGGAAGGGGGIGYASAGGWGSLCLPFQSFVTAFRPLGAGIAGVSGWCGGQGGYGEGAIEYASFDMLAGVVTDAEILAAIADVMPVSSIAWTAISN